MEGHKPPGDKNKMTDSKQQEKNRLVVDQEIFCCVSSEATYILSQDDDQAPFSYDDIENLYDENEKAQEVLEWWKCSNWFIEKLAEIGEVVIPHANLWGRTCSGQAILLDNTITQIQKKYYEDRRGLK